MSAIMYAFRTLKKCLTTAPLLVTPRTGPNATFAISTDASNKGTGAILLQEQSDGSLKPCSYYARTLNKARRKYHVYDQELLAIAAALNNEYRIDIEGCSSFVVISESMVIDRSSIFLLNPRSEEGTFLGYQCCLNT